MTEPAPLRLAIVTVVRDDRTGLADTYDSLGGQLGSGIVWLVADGGSTDGTAEWLAEHADIPIWWRSARDSGLYDAMNDALDSVRSFGCSHVLFLNAGDRLAAPDSGSRLLQAIAQAPGCSLLYGDALERQGDGRILLKRARSHRWARFGMFTHHQAMVFHVTALAGLRFDAAYRIAADYAFTLAVLERGPAARLNWPVCLFAPGGLSQRDSTTGRNEQATIRQTHFGDGVAFTAMIALAQRVALAVRQRFPATYAKLRFRCPET
ncbi:glycosyltransferase [Azospirillum sp. 412522]|nr:glycosyltransferase [Azospirillum sp. 412522]MBY6265077.1 glycosyltransferase [Azospirillum sp. 412522]